MKLRSNSFGYNVTAIEATLYYSESKHPLAKKVTKEKYTEIINSASDEDIIQFSEKVDEFYYAFIPLKGLDKRLNINLEKNKTLRREFVKWKLYEVLIKHYIINLYNFGSDLTIYLKNSVSRWPGWDSYTAFNIIIRDWEIHLSIGSRNTLISQKELEDFTYKGLSIVRAVHEGHIFHKSRLSKGNYQCIATMEVRIQEKLGLKPERPNYSKYYDEILKIYNDIAANQYVGISIMQIGFQRLEENNHYFQVARHYNVMLFKDENTNVNASNGMKLNGPYEVPYEKLKNLEFIFIYPNSEKAKELFFCLKNGKTSYYPGLERYAHISVPQPNREAILKYSYHDFERLPELVSEHIRNVKRIMPEKLFFAIVLLPKGKKKDQVANDMGDLQYYELKKVFMENEIPSQFLDERSIGTDSFVYFLPNISIAILAKLGGIPWRLHRPAEKELIIGFGDASKSENNFIGSTVFFDNSGRLKANNYFLSSNIKEFIQTLIISILDYIKESGQEPERLIIHYYKLPGNKEKQAVSKALQYIGIDIPYVIVTINETKAKDYIAFDEDYGFGMPLSGIAWKISKGEFVLFNNMRYESWPRSGKPLRQEYPIKLKVFFSNEQSYSDHSIKRIIGQVFEFSRIYWKSVQQQSRPVTASYAEMIAEFGEHFRNGNNPIPKNWVTQSTPWFI